MEKAHHLLAAGSTATIGRKHLHFAEIDSTNTYLKEYARQLPHGTTVTADHQFAGKGRLGRSWEDNGEDVLKCSILLKELTLQNMPQLPAVTGLAVCLALENMFGKGFQIKWPNDVLYDKKKICGILCESKVSSANQAEQGNYFAVCGIGINLSNTKQYFDENQLPYATSVQLATGIKPDIGEVYKVLIYYFEQVYLCYLQQGFKKILAMYQEKCATLGREVLIQNQNMLNPTVGMAISIDEEGQLICLVDGKEVVVRAGEASVRGLYGCLF